MNIINNKKKDIIDRLNELFNNYEELSIFCNYLSNDINKIIEKINKIIKYSFIEKSFIYDKKSLISILYDIKIKDVDKLYKEFLEKSSRKKLFLFIIKEQDVTSNFSISIDEDINLNDIKGLIIPSKEKLELIIANNLATIKEVEDKKKKEENYYKEQMVFNETAFIYTRKEFITIDSSFIYYHCDLSGDINYDYDKLYNDDRYCNISDSLNPLNNRYEDNIQKIKERNDISLRKLGNLYEIENGRHRIIYILKNGGKVTIPASISRRIEDKEFNIILNDLKKDYNVHIYKNNLLNDDANILLVLDGIAYIIENKKELKKFTYNLKNGINDDIFSNIPFKVTSDINEKEIILRYRKFILNKYFLLGKEILTSNFTDIIKYFDGVNLALLYKAFSSIQYDYQSSLIFKDDFDKECSLYSNNDVLDNNIIKLRHQ